MRILFVGLTTHYTDGLMYQENCFNSVLAENGHEVLFLADTQCFEDGKLKFTEPCEYIDNNGVRIVRVPYLISNYIGSRLKIFKSIYKYIEEFKPDIIYCHSPQYLSVIDVIRYKKIHPNVLVYADTHTSFVNSKKGIMSYLFLYKVYYKHLYKMLEPYLEKYFYIGLGERDFSEQVYNADKSKMAFLPLSGNEITKELHAKNRSEIRDSLSIREDDIVLFHSGKLSKDKNTDWVIDALRKINSKKLKLVIAGSIPQDNKKLKNALESSENISYVGWLSGEELVKYLCACDAYCQPGAPSVTLQTAICCKTPIICYKHDFYSYLYSYDNIKWITSEDEIADIINKVLNDRNVLINLKNAADKNSFKLDTKYLLKKEIGV